MFYYNIYRYVLMSEVLLKIECFKVKTLTDFFFIFRKKMLKGPLNWS